MGQPGNLRESLVSPRGQAIAWTGLGILGLLFFGTGAFLLLADNGTGGHQAAVVAPAERRAATAPPTRTAPALAVVSPPTATVAEATATSALVEEPAAPLPTPVRPPLAAVRTASPTDTPSPTPTETPSPAPTPTAIPLRYCPGGNSGPPTR